MIKKLLLIFGIFVLLFWSTTIIFFPVIIIDGQNYSKRAIFKIKKQRKKYFDINLTLLSEKIRRNIEKQFSAYIDDINEISSDDYTDRSLSEIITETISEINIAENKFNEEFENILKYKTKRFILPLQIRDISNKDAIVKDIFPKRIKYYSMNDKVYYSIALDVVKEKLIIFKDEFPQTAQSVIETNVNYNHEQYLSNLASQIEINANVNYSLQNIIHSLRKNGETLWFFEYLLQECDITGIFENKYSTIELFDMSEDFKPVLLPVCIVDKTVYDAFALKSVSKKSRLLRNSWKQIREEKIEEILNRQQEIIAHNLSLYNDIDDGIDIDELSALIAYYGEQIPVSADLFSKELKQCICTVKETDKYPIESFSDVIDVSPLSIDMIKINNIFYDADAVLRLTNVITAIRRNWNIFLFSEDAKIKESIRKNFINYYKNNANNYLMDIENMASVIDYISESADISGDIFLYFYDNCSIMTKNFTGTIIESSIMKIDIEPFILDVIEIDGGGYFASGVNALKQSMENLSSTIVIDIRENLSSIINTKTNKCVANIDAYLAWYFDDGLSNDWITSLWRAFKEKAFGYDHVAELNKKYQQHFYPFLEMENEIQICLLQYSERVQDLAVYYIMWLNVFQMSPYLFVQTEQIIEGNDFMVPCQKVPDYIKSFIENAGERLKLSFIRVDDIEVLNFIRIIMNLGADIAMDVTAGAIGGVVGGPPGMAIGIGVSIIVSLAANAATSKMLKAQKYDEYSALLRDSFEKNCEILIAIL